MESLRKKFLTAGRKLLKAMKENMQKNSGKKLTGTTVRNTMPREVLNRRKRRLREKKFPILRNLRKMKKTSARYWQRLVKN